MEQSSLYTPSDNTQAFTCQPLRYCPSCKQYGTWTRNPTRDMYAGDKIFEYAYKCTTPGCGARTLRTAEVEVS